MSNLCKSKKDQKDCDIQARLKAQTRCFDVEEAQIYLILLPDRSAQLN